MCVCVCTCVYVCVCTCVRVCVCMCVTPCVSQMGSVRGAVERQDAESQLLLLAFSHELTLCGGQGLNAPAAESMRPLCGRNVAQTSGVVKKGDLTLTGREGGAVGLGGGRGRETRDNAGRRRVSWAGLVDRWDVGFGVVC